MKQMTRLVSSTLFSKLDSYFVSIELNIKLNNPPEKKVFNKTRIKLSIKREKEQINGIIG